MKTAIVTASDATKAAAFATLSPEQLHHGLAEVLKTLKKPPHRLADEEFSLLTQWLTYSVDVLSAERLQTLRRIKDSIKQERYPPAIETICLAQAAQLPFIRDDRRIDASLRDIKKTLLSSSSRGDESPSDQMRFPGDQKGSERPKRWGSFEEKRNG